MKLFKRKELKHEYGNKVINNAYEKFFAGEHMTYEEFIMMLATNDELYFMYNDREYRIGYDNKDSVSMCVTKYEDGTLITERYEVFATLIELLYNFKVDGKTIREIWSNVYFTKCR